jgi:hypothetical protein
MARPADTAHDAYVAQILALRVAGPEARLAMALDLSDAVRAVAAAGIRARHPEYTSAEVEASLAQLYHGGPGAPR